jgi:hypothetical protein
MILVAVITNARAGLQLRAEHLPSMSQVLRSIPGTGKMVTVMSDAFYICCIRQPCGTGPLLVLAWK